MEKDIRWLVLLTVIVGTFLGRLDQTIVNLALPRIIDEFSITVTQAGWIATAYILANAVFVPIWGKLGDTIGRKKVYLWGFGIFIFGSVLAGLSWDLSSMIVFRIIQAIASSADYPTAMAIIAVTFREGKERAQALGLWSTAFAASAVFGPLIGGPLIDTFGWRSVFLINLPVGIVGIIMAVMFVKESTSEKKTVKFDWLGALTLGITLCALVLVLDKGMEWGWLSIESVLCYATIVGFGYIFYQIDSKHPEPIVDFKFFKIGAFTNTLINNFIVFMGMMGSLFLLPVFVQTFLGYDATQTGFIFMPMAFGMILAAPLGASLVGKVQPKYVIAASTLVAAIGLFMFTGLDPRSGPMDLVIPVLIMSFGMGFGMSQRTSIIAWAVPEQEIGVASSVLALARNIAGAFGIALFATILNNAVENNVLNIASNSIINTNNPLILQQVVPLMILKAQISAYPTVFILSTAIVLIGAVLALGINVKEKKSGAEVFVE
ncbi:Putative multidrug resistance protein MdtD [Candidatus Bilamarchaeum dharawalense]|uniref:Multidrug resistance protein MdtD n=1 Tax=Candidatus Bilamarchaeum dharawalense TaxID=2885759 RepID=A0A5E4LSH1_9ARCH|nr:Putative multidrug resistance protein MdtD [Candidatus Bilamarchaeum dharawalense]